MPIYAYRCAACGHAQDVLQKMSDPLLTQCPACGAQAYTKQVTAAGLQLKGSGWYVTDFRGGNNAAKKETKEDRKAEGGDKTADKAADKPSDKGSDKPAEKTAAKAPEKSADKSAAPAAAPAPGPSPTPSSSGS
jgi:putative FmdB family regulatory protein